jgi:hypothetical protein
MSELNKGSDPELKSMPFEKIPKAGEEVLIIFCHLSSGFYNFSVLFLVTTGGWMTA